MLSGYDYLYDINKWHISVYMLTFPRAAAISNVPTVSIFDAIIGIPWYVRLELRNVICRNKSTYNRKQNCSFSNRHAFVATFFYTFSQIDFVFIEEFCVQHSLELGSSVCSFLAWAARLWSPTSPRWLCSACFQRTTSRTCNEDTGQRSKRWRERDWRATDRWKRAGHWCSESSDYWILTIV